MRLTFLGADHEVTGSCHMLETCKKVILVDCGMEQGPDIYENQEIPVNPADIDYVLLTHAHIDHSGLLPLLYKRGFKGTVPYRLSPSVPQSPESAPNLQNAWTVATENSIKCAKERTFFPSPLDNAHNTICPHWILLPNNLPGIITYCFQIFTPVTYISPALSTAIRHRALSLDGKINNRISVVINQRTEFRLRYKSY